MTPNDKNDHLNNLMAEVWNEAIYKHVMARANLIPRIMADSPKPAPLSTGRRIRLWLDHRTYRARKAFVLAVCSILGVTLHDECE
jgi:hypothetical protein